MSYVRPTSLNELEKALAQKEDNTYLCAGATDLMIQLREKKKFHYGLIDLTHIEELTQIEETEKELRIGAEVTMTALEESKIIQAWMPALSKAASMVGSTQIRNRATIGGNAANASQSSDLLPVLLAYEAKVVILNEKGLQTTKLLEDVLQGRGKTSLTNQEVMIYFLIPKSQDVSGFWKVGSRKSVTISKINACIKAAREDNRLTKVRIYLGAVGLKAERAPLIEEALEGQCLDNVFDSLEEEKLKKAVYAQIEANIPDRPSKHYKKSAAFGVIVSIVEDMRWKS